MNLQRCNHSKPVFIYGGVTCTMKVTYWLILDEKSCIRVNITCSIEHSPSSVANRISASQEIPRILWNPKVHYRARRALHLFLSWARSIQSMPLYRTSWRTILILPFHSTPGASKWSLSLSFLQILYTPLLSPMRAAYPTISFLSISSPVYYFRLMY